MRQDSQESGTASGTQATATERAAPIDGRRRRSERTRQLIIEAFLLIVRETSQAPTAAQVADRAGYSVRSIFERFPDLGALRLAVTDRAITEARAEATPVDLSADRTTRLKERVATRARICDKWLPLWRVMSAHDETSPEMRSRVKLIRELVMDQFDAVFRPELSSLPETEHRHTLIAMEAMTDFESWARMREYFDLSYDEAGAVWFDALDALLPETPAVS